MSWSILISILKENLNGILNLIKNKAIDVAFNIVLKLKGHFKVNGLVWLTLIAGIVLYFIYR